MTARIEPNKPSRRGDHQRLDAASVTNLLPDLRRAYWDRMARDITLAVRGNKLSD